MGFQIARMTGSLVVMATDEDGLSRGGIGGYIDTVFVGEDSFSMLLFSETGVEGGRNGSIHPLECLEDKGVQKWRRIGCDGRGKCQ